MPLVPVLLGGSTTEGNAWSLCWTDCWTDCWNPVGAWEGCWDECWTDCWAGAGAMVYPVNANATAVASAHFENTIRISWNSTAIASASLTLGTYTDITGEATVLATASFDTTQTTFVAGTATGGSYARLTSRGGGWADCWISLGINWTDCWTESWRDCWGTSTEESWHDEAWGASTWGLNTWADRDRAGTPWADCWIAYGGTDIPITADQVLEVTWTRHDYECPDNPVRYNYEVESIRREYIGE